MFKAAKASHKKDFTAALEEMKSLHKKAGEYVRKIRPEKWARSFFPGRRFGHVTSNMAESMNNWLKEARHLDPIGSFRCYIRKLNMLFEKRRKRYMVLRETDLPMNVAKMLSECVEEGRKLKVLVHTSALFEVQRKNDPLFWRVVDLNTPSCTCSFFDEFGIPCRHMCAAAIHVNIHPKTLVIKQLQVVSLKETYEGSIVPVDLNNLEDDGTKPPRLTRMRGRPKVKRIPSSAEKQTRRTVVCGKCGLRGHNARTCKGAEPNVD